MNPTPAPEVAAAIAEHHRLHGHRRAHGIIDAVDAAVVPRPLIVPGAKHGLDRGQQLLHRILRKRLAGERERELERFLGDLAERRAVELARAASPCCGAVPLSERIELPRIGAVHDLGEVAHQTPVAVAHLARVAGGAQQAG